MLASATAEQEAEGAARNAIKHVYILAGYAEPRKASSAACEQSRLLPSRQQSLDVTAVCTARAKQGSSANDSSGSKLEEHAMNDRYLVSHVSMLSCTFV